MGRDCGKFGGCTYIVDCCRTAYGSFGSSLKDTPAADLGTVALENVKEEGISWDL